MGTGTPAVASQTSRRCSFAEARALVGQWRASDEGKESWCRARGLKHLALGFPESALSGLDHFAPDQSHSGRPSGRMEQVAREHIRSVRQPRIRIHPITLGEPLAAAANCDIFEAVTRVVSGEGMSLELRKKTREWARFQQCHQGILGQQHEQKSINCRTA